MHQNIAETTTSSKSSAGDLHGDIPDKNVLNSTKTENDNKRKMEGGPVISEEKHAKLKTSGKTPLAAQILFDNGIYGVAWYICT
jgi:hypothetical protein